MPHVSQPTESEAVMEFDPVGGSAAAAVGSYKIISHLLFQVSCESYYFCYPPRQLGIFLQIYRQ